MLGTFLMGAWFAIAPGQTHVSAGEEAVRAMFEDQCTMCHDGSGDPSTPSGLSLARAPGELLGVNSAATGQSLVTPGSVESSYLWAKLVGGSPAYACDDGSGEAMAPGDRDLLAGWIEAGLPGGDAWP